MSAPLGAVPNVATTGNTLQWNCAGAGGRRSGRAAVGAEGGRGCWAHEDGGNEGSVPGHSAREEAGQTGAEAPAGTLSPILVDCLEGVGGGSGVRQPQRGACGQARRPPHAPRTPPGESHCQGTRWDGGCQPLRLMWRDCKHRHAPASCATAEKAQSESIAATPHPSTATAIDAAARGTATPARRPEASGAGARGIGSAWRL